MEDKQDEYRDLWAAVLHQAIDDAVSDSTDLRATGTKATAAECLSARRWIASDRWLFNSFRGVCDMLELDPGRVRQEIKKTGRPD